MKFDNATQWLLTPVQAKAKESGATLKAWARRWLLIPLIVVLAYWIGTHNADGTTTGPATTPRTTYTQPADLQTPPAGGEQR
ncbi:hypothetical protein HRW16_19650 [Streptomyces lunaelactis]|uniref:hypothetical protein n=1 Tax=Streptomyces lunaelactis TaxID=1535768 RepID=UPI001585CB17|nr:hypothetical protein [Streptomyces lunaelactis]NUK94007.1 hypothetical protein [Streptomyces lunaelactis]